MKYVIVRDTATGKHHLRFSDLPLEPHLQEVGEEYDLGRARRRVDLLNHPELVSSEKIRPRSWWEQPRPGAQKVVVSSFFSTADSGKIQSLDTPVVRQLTAEARGAVKASLRRLRRP